MDNFSTELFFRVCVSSQWHTLGNFYASLSLKKWWSFGGEKGTRWKNNNHLLSLASGSKCMILGETAYICVYTVFCLFCLKSPHARVLCFTVFSSFVWRRRTSSVIQSTKARLVFYSSPRVSYHVYTKETISTLGICSLQLDILKMCGYESTIFIFLTNSLICVNSTKSNIFWFCPVFAQTTALILTLRLSLDCFSE